MSAERVGMVIGCGLAVAIYAAAFRLVGGLSTAASVGLGCALAHTAWRLHRLEKRAGLVK